MIDIPTIPKNIRSSLIFITFLRIRNSGKDKPTTAIINASHVPSGIHFAMSACTMGMTLVAFAYMGIQTSTAMGTANGLCLVMYFSKNPVGMYPWMTAPTPTHNSIYGMTFFVIDRASLVISFILFLKTIFI